MGKKTACVFLALLLVSTLQLVVRIPQVKAWNGTVYIHADGSIDPPTAPIQQNGNLYTLISNIVSDGDGIVIEKSSITFDGNGYTVQGNHGGNGLSLTSISDVTIRNTNVQGFYYGVFLAPASQSIIAGNNITANDIGIVLISSSDYNNIAGNNIKQNDAYGIYVDSSSNNNIYHNNFADNLQQVFTSYSTSIWDHDYPSGGNHWSGYDGTDADGDGIGDTPYIIDLADRDNYPLVNSWSPPDTAVVNLTTSKTVVFQGLSLPINLTIQNQGNKIEGFNATICVNSTITKKQCVTLLSGNSIMTTVMWNTTGFPRSNYSLSGYAEPIEGETDTADNNFTDGYVVVSMVGDLVGKSGVPDGKCDILDVSVVAKCFGSYPGCPPPQIWNPNCDITGLIAGVPDDKVNILDVSVVAKHFGQHDQ